MSNITNYYIVLIFINLNEIHKLYIEYIIIQISFSPNKQQSLSKSQDRPAAASPPYEQLPATWRATHPTPTDPNN